MNPEGCGDGRSAQIGSERFAVVGCASTVGSDGGGSDALEGSLVDGGAVGGQEDGSVSLAERDDGRKHFAQMVLHLESAAFVTAGERRWIKDDAVEPLVSAFEAREHVHHIVGIEAMGLGGEAVQGEVCFSSVEGFSGEVDATGFCTGAGGRDREGAGVGEEVQ